MLPRCNTDGMTLHLEEISATVSPAPATSLCSIRRVGTARRPYHPANIRLLSLPSKYPELDPVDIICQFVRDNWLPNC